MGTPRLSGSGSRGLYGANGAVAGDSENADGGSIAGEGVVCVSGREARREGGEEDRWRGEGGQGEGAKVRIDFGESGESAVRFSGGFIFWDTKVMVEEVGL